MRTYPRLYADADGESHFEDIEIDLASTDYAPPAPPLDLSSFTPATQIGFMRAEAGWSSDWHLSSSRNIFFVLRRMGSHRQRWRSAALCGRQRAAG